MGNTCMSASEKEERSKADMKKLKLLKLKGFEAKVRLLALRLYSQFSNRFNVLIPVSISMRWGGLWGRAGSAR